MGNYYSSTALCENWRPFDTQYIRAGSFKKADYQLGTRDINEGYRRAIRDLIQSIENTPEILEIKPGIFGVNLNINALLKTIKRFRKKMG